MGGRSICVEASPQKCPEVHVPKLKIVKAHSVSLEEAAKRIKVLVADVAGDYPKLINTVTWSDDGLAANAKGTGFHGEFQVDERQISVNINLSFIATPFKGRVETGVTKKLAAAFPE